MRQVTEALHTKQEAPAILLDSLPHTTVPRIQEAAAAPRACQAGAWPLPRRLAISALTTSENYHLKQASENRYK